jgi:hypothetical protein
MRLKTPVWAASLGVMMLGGLLLRLHAISFGLPGLYDPDELMFEMGAIRMLSHATLNPGWFGHPATTTMYGLAIVNMGTFGFGHAMGWFPTLKSFGAAVYANPAWVIMPGRVLMAVFGAGTVWQTGLLGRDLFDRRVGLIGAAVVAISPLCVAWGQVIRSDIMGSFFVLLALRASLRADARPGWRADLAVAGWLGVAVVTKWPMGLACLGMGGLMLGAVLARRMSVGAMALRSARFAVMMAGVIVLVSPYLVLAHDTVVRNLHGEAQMHHLGATGGPPLWNLDWYLRGPLMSGLGLAGLVLAGAGLVLSLLRRDRRAAWLLVPVVLGMGVVICGQRLVWDRWVLPLVPLLAIFVGAAVVAGAGRFGAKGRWVMALCLAAIAVPMATQDVMQARGRMNDTRQHASAWAVAHIPAGSTVLIEHFAFDLYPRPWGLLFPIGDAGCVDVRALLKGQMGYGFIDNARGTRANVDYGTMARSKDGTCRADYAILTQFDRYEAEKSDFPQEDAAYRRLVAQGRVVASFFPQRGVSAGPIVRIVQFSRSPM